MQFNSKLLLFGEYTILNGSKALAIPFPSFYGQWSNSSNPNPELKKSHAVLLRLFNYIKEKAFIAKCDLNKLSTALTQGLAFESNIPQGYGLGSSGALCAALYQQYFYNKPEDINQIKQDLAKIESYFHGDSSGVDPLVSYLNKALLLNPDETIPNFTLNDQMAIFLIDTEQKRSTEKLIPLYKQKSKANPDFNQALVTQTNRTIAAYLNHSPNLYSEIQHFCILQNHFLSEQMVFPKALSNYKLIFGEMLSIKLCGAGGGGYLLAFTPLRYYNEVLDKLKALGVKSITILPTA